jgi:SAM-dependent methyltransferase
MPADDITKSSTQWNEHYRNAHTPWETGRPSSELVRIVAEDRIAPCRAIELGCGSGVNARWLAAQGFEVTALDFSSLAIERARANAAATGAAVRFLQADVLNVPADLGTFPFFFDRGCYHAVRRYDAPAYVETLRRITSPGSLGLLLTGNAKQPHEPDQGPPVVAEEEIHAELGPLFDIVRLREFQFDDADPRNSGPLGWSCLVRRR